MSFLCGIAHAQALLADKKATQTDAGHETAAAAESLLIGPGDLLHVTIFR
jgi:hypothetical protein